MQRNRLGQACTCGDPSYAVICADEPLLSPLRLLDAYLSWSMYQREGIPVGSLRRFLRFHRREQVRPLVEGERYNGRNPSYRPRMARARGQLLEIFQRLTGWIVIRD